jgi:uncharacterized membrane protein
MTLMILGLVLFLGVHLVPTGPTLRVTLLARLGERRYKGVFSLVSLAGFVLIVLGYRMADHGAQVFAPWPLAIAIAPYAVTVAFVLFAAANMRAHLRHVLRHPMLLGLLIWSLVHLLANGDARGTVLFGAFAAYAIVDLISAVNRRAVKTFTPTATHDAIAIVAGIALALVVMRYHGPLFGPTVVPFGA